MIFKIIILSFYSFSVFSGIGNVPKYNYNHGNHTLQYRVSCKKCHRGPSSGFKISQGLCHQCHVKKDPTKYQVKNFDCTTCHVNHAPEELDFKGNAVKNFNGIGK